VHKTPASLNEQGLLAAEHFVRNVMPISTSKYGYVLRNAPSIGGSVTYTGASPATIEVLAEKRVATGSVPTAVTYAAQTPADNAAVGYRNGAIVTVKAGDGALSQNGTGGNAILLGGTGNGTGNGGDAIVQGGAETGSGRKGYVLINGAIYGSIFSVAWGGQSAETTTDTTYRKIVNGWNANGSVNGITPDESTGIMTVLVAGVYELFYSLTVEATSAEIFRVEPVLSSVGATNTPYYESRLTGGGANPVCTSGISIISIPVNDTVSLWHRSETSGTRSFKIVAGQFSVKRISD
jgi:hypothetical protein